MTNNSDLNSTYGKYVETDSLIRVVPNVVIESPKVRKIVRTTLDVIGGLAFIAQVSDLSSPFFDIASFTVPVLVSYAAARVVFGLAVDNPNTPKG